MAHIPSPRPTKTRQRQHSTGSTKSTTLIPAALALLLLSSCGNFPDVSNDQKVMLYPVDSDSLFYPYPEKKASFWDEGKSTPALHERLSALDRKFKEGHYKEIVLFVHGGLNAEQQGLGGAVHKLAAMESKDRLPIFVTWDSGLLSSYGRHLMGDENGISNYGSSMSRAQQAGNVMINLPTDLLVGVAETPRTILRGWKKSLQSFDPVFDADNKRYIVRNTYEKTLAAPPFNLTQDQIRKDGFLIKANGNRLPWSVSLGSNDGTRYGRGMAALASSPVTMALSPAYQGVGRPAWENMQRKAHTLISRYPTLIDMGDRNKGRANGVMADVMRTVAKWKKDNPSLKITLVGHSMGTIVLNDVFRAMDRTDFRDTDSVPYTRVDRIVYLAAACSIRDFSNGAGRYLAHNSKTQFYNLCLHPNREMQEEFPSPVFRLTLSGSLLMWIDEFFQSPRDFEDRTFGSFENCIIAYRMLPRTSRFHLKAFSDESNWRGENATPYSGPQKHGQFGDYAFFEDTFLLPETNRKSPYRKP